MKSTISPGGKNWFISDVQSSQLCVQDVKQQIAYQSRSIMMALHSRKNELKR